MHPANGCVEHRSWPLGPGFARPDEVGHEFLFAQANSCRQAVSWRLTQSLRVDQRAGFLQRHSAYSRNLEDTT